MAEGLFLSSLAENFLRARGAEEARSRAAGAEARDIFETERYLEELGREREVREDLLPTVLAHQRTRWAPQTRAPVPSSATYEGIPNPEAPLPAPSFAAGGMAALQQPPRAPIAETLLGALNPKQQARFLTSRTGRMVMPTLQASELERQKEEERHEAGAFFDQAKAALYKGDTVEGLNHIASGFRRLGDYGQTTQHMLLAAKTSATKDEQTSAAEDAKTLLPLVDAYKTEPTPEKLAKLRGAEPKSLAWRTLFTEILADTLKHALSPDRDEDNFLRAFMTSDKSKSEEQAWAEAAKQHPQGLFKFAMQELRSGRAVLPESVWEGMRLKRPLALKDTSLRGLAHTKTLMEANAARQAGQPWTPEREVFLSRFVANINEMQRAEAEGKKSATEKQREEDVAKITRIRRERMETPENLETKTSEQLTTLIQRTARDLDAIVDPQERQETEDYLKLLRQARNRKEGAKGPKVDPLVDLQAEYSRLRKRGLSPEKARDDLKRRGLLD